MLSFLFFAIPISLANHDPHQLVEVEASVLVLVRLVNEPGRLLLSEGISYVCHQVLELLCAHSPTPVLVQGSEGESDHLLVLGVAHLVRHHVTKLRQLYFSRSIGIVLKLITMIFIYPVIIFLTDSVNELLELNLSGVEAHDPHCPAELPGGDEVVQVLVTLPEGLLQLVQLLHVEKTGPHLFHD